MKYTGVKCPVCHQEFDDNADIVVCPECGMPHHRNCYAEKGACAFEANHKDNFTFVNPNKVEEETHNVKVEVRDIKELSKDMPLNGVIGEIGIDKDGNRHPVYREIMGGEKIGKYTVDDYAKVVDKNAFKFIPRFLKYEKTGKKISWNWAAFIFGPIYFAYRKMWKAAFLTMLCILILPIIFMGEVSDYYSEVEHIYSDVLTSSEYKSSEDMAKAVEGLEDKLPEQPKALALAGDVELVIDIVAALFANYLYMLHCTEVLDKASKIDNLENRDKYIKKKGGRSVLAVVIYLIVVSIAIEAISIIVASTGTDIATLLRKLIK